MRTKWSCDDCGYAGHVEHAPDEGVMGVVRLIDDAHRTTSAQCHAENGNTGIRVTIERIAASGGRDGGE